MSISSDPTSHLKTTDMNCAKTLSVLSLLVLAGFFAGYPKQAEEDVITIEFSSVDGTPLTLESSFLFKKAEGEDSLEKVMGITPFSITGEGIAYGGIVRKTEGEGELRVVMYKGSNENRKQVASGEGEVIFLNEYGGGRRTVATF